MGLGIRTSLDFVITHRRNLYPSARFANGLVNLGAFGVGEGALLPNKHQVAHARAYLRHLSHFSISRQQQIQLVIQRYGEGIDLQRSGVVSDTFDRRTQHVGGR